MPTTAMNNLKLVLTMRIEEKEGRDGEEEDYKFRFWKISHCRILIGLC
jgi:hypothetical protein